MFGLSGKAKHSVSVFLCCTLTKCAQLMDNYFYGGGRVNEKSPWQQKNSFISLLHCSTLANNRLQHLWKSSEIALTFLNQVHLSKMNDKHLMHLVVFVCVRVSMFILFVFKERSTLSLHVSSLCHLLICTWSEWEKCISPQWSLNK